MNAVRGWRGQAACRDVDPELFFPVAESGPAYDAQVAAAKAVCRRCPVKAECLDEAMARIPHGVAGGLTAAERRERRRLVEVAAAAGMSVGEVLSRLARWADEQHAARIFDRARHLAVLALTGGDGAR